MASIPLPPLPAPNYIKAHHMTSEDLRARDQEIVRCVLEAAAKIGCQRTSNRYDAFTLECVAEIILALEFHHE